MKQARAAIGFRAKTGRAIAVALIGPIAQPSLIWRQEISLVDPELPQTGQPFHEVMDLTWPRAQKIAEQYVQAIEVVASNALVELIGDLKSRGYAIAGVAAVGSHDRQLDRIGNPHMRAHAAEGMVFRHAIETAAAAEGFRAHSFSDRTILDDGAARLHLSPHELESRLKDIGSQAGPPWRADHKAAAVGAWIALSSREP